MARRKAKKRKKKPGPKSERLKIDMNWVDAIKTSLRKKKPIRGWPEPATE
jgi:hypothetical protein